MVLMVSKHNVFRKIGSYKTWTWILLSVRRQTIQNKVRGCVLMNCSGCCLRYDFDLLFAFHEVVDDLVKDDFLYEKEKSLRKKKSILSKLCWTMEKFLKRRDLKCVKSWRKFICYPAVWCFWTFIGFHVSQFHWPFIIEFLQVKQNRPSLKWCSHQCYRSLTRWLSSAGPTFSLVMSNRPTEYRSHCR